MMYLKTYRQIEGERAAKRLRRNLLVVLGVLVVLALLGLAGAIDFRSRYA
jgi:Tfp pilus assembly protein PilX